MDDDKPEQSSANNAGTGSDSDTGLTQPVRKTFRADLTAERLREVLDYDADTGEFRWRVAMRGGARAGDKPGSKQKSGHFRIKVDGTLYMASRLAFLWMTGKFPALLMDHKHGNPSNDRWLNLREATTAQNNRNRRQSNSGSGFKGVSRSRRRWKAQITVGDKQIYLGMYNTPEAAHAAYIDAATKHFGEFACAGRP